jgi:hypothetical protein
MNNINEINKAMAEFEQFQSKFKHLNELNSFFEIASKELSNVLERIPQRQIDPDLGVIYEAMPTESLYENRNPN